LLAVAVAVKVLAEAVELAVINLQSVLLAVVVRLHQL
jgi:hypothetical protein